MKRLLSFATLLSVPAIAVPTAEPGPTFFEALRKADVRLATIAERLVTANVALCDKRAPTLGFVLHGLNQYDRSVWPAARRAFVFATPVSVEAVVPGGSADRGGVRADDGVLALGDHALPTADQTSQPGSAERDLALAALDAMPPDGPVGIELTRQGRTFRTTLNARPGCRSHFEIVVGRGFDAQADGLHVQLGEKFFEGFSDDEIAVVVAHELAHNILRHRERLDAAKVGRGLAAEFGRNARLFRQTEDEADALSVYLLVNAGFDPFSPGRFWRAYADRIGVEGIFRSRTHASGKARAAAVDVIAASIAGQEERPIMPALLTNRDKPLR